MSKERNWFTNKMDAVIANQPKGRLTKRELQLRLNKILKRVVEAKAMRQRENAKAERDDADDSLLEALYHAETGLMALGALQRTL
jgi:hypothetical protein